MAGWRNGSGSSAGADAGDRRRVHDIIYKDWSRAKVSFPTIADGPIARLSPADCVSTWGGSAGHFLAVTEIMLLVSESDMTVHAVLYHHLHALSRVDPPWPDPGYDHRTPEQMSGISRSRDNATPQPGCNAQVNCHTELCPVSNPDGDAAHTQTYRYGEPNDHRNHAAYDTVSQLLAPVTDAFKNIQNMNFPIAAREFVKKQAEPARSPSDIHSVSEKRERCHRRPKCRCRLSVSATPPRSAHFSMTGDLNIRNS